jgi:hypothetical protein
MDLDQGGRQLAGLILDTAGRGQHDQVADLIAPFDVEQLRSLVTVLAVQVDQSAPASSATGPAAVCETAQLLEAVAGTAGLRAPGGPTTRLSRGDRSHLWSALRRPRRTGAAGAGPRDHGVHMSEAAREEAALEEEARQRTEEIRATEEATEEAAAQAAASDSGPSPDAEIAQVHRSGRQHDHTDTAAYQRPQLGRRRGPRR